METKNIEVITQKEGFGKFFAALNQGIPAVIY